MIPQDVTLFTWLDVEEVLFRSSQEGRWPTSLFKARTFWDSLSLSIKPGVDEEILNWLSIEFEPRFDRDKREIVLESYDNHRSLSVYLEPTDDDPSSAPFIPSFSRPAVLRRHGLDNFPQPGEQVHPPVVAFHSFKGGVGRTVHALTLALALAKERMAKVLLIDGDLEAPGLSWLFFKRMPKPPVSYMDLLSLVHGDPDLNAQKSIKLVASRLRDALVDGIYILPAFRSVKKFTSLDIKPEHLIQSDDPYILTRVLSSLGKELGVDLVIVDLRAGLSEISASLLLDPRVYRVFVTTLSAQSLQGTCLLLELMGKEAPSVSPNQPLPSWIISQVPDDKREGVLDQGIKDLVLASANLMANCSDQDEQDEQPRIAYSVTSFDKDLTVLPDSWDEAIKLIKKSGLSKDLADILNWLPSTSFVKSDVTEVNAKRDSLASYAYKMIYAESGEVTEFLRIRPLERLSSEFSTKVPIAVVIGAKGSGKTFTYLQIARGGDWRSFGSMNQQSALISATIISVIKPIKLEDAAKAILDASKENSAKVLGLPHPCNWDDIIDDIRERLKEDSHESKWRDYWLDYIAWSTGFRVNERGAGREFPNYLREKKLQAVAIIDGLENYFLELSSDKNQQIAVRSLLQDVPNWLDQQISRPLGIVVFIRRDLVMKALPQNSAQFIAVYTNFELNWSSEEALRLCAWIAFKTKVLVDINEEKIEKSDKTDLEQCLYPLWGRKLAREDSREAFSANWVIYALSDFNGQIQARDIVRFLYYASDKSKGDSIWYDRVLVPAAIRKSLLPCSEKKVEETIQENKELESIFKKLNNIPSDSRRVPFERKELSLDAEEIAILEREGVVEHDGDEYYICEIFRSGLGFNIKKGKKPKVTAMAIKAQRQRRKLL